jgi:hypothetical protein
MLFLIVWVRKLYGSLRDEKFDKYNDDEDYMSDNEDDNAGQEVAEPYENDIPESENEVSMNIISLFCNNYITHFLFYELCV